MANKKNRPKYGPGPGSGPRPTRPTGPGRVTDARTETETRPPSRQVSTTIRSRPQSGPDRRGGSGRKPTKSNNTPLFIAGGLVAVALLAALAFLLLGQKEEKIVPTEGDIPIGPDPSAQARSFPDQGQAHLSPGQKVENLLGTGYNSNPPTSGPHAPNWSDWGIFTQRVPDELQIHNLEHGGIIIQYDCATGCPAAINALSGYARRYPPQSFTGIMLAPRPGLPDGARLALTAWGNRLLLKTVDVDKINQFIGTYIGKGPEKDPNFRP